MKSTHESEIVLARMEDICPSSMIDDVDIDLLEKSVKVAFEIIGYKPNDIRVATEKAVEKMGHKGELYRLCYNAWRMD